MAIKQQSSLLNFWQRPKGSSDDEDGGTRGARPGKNMHTGLKTSMASTKPQTSKKRKREPLHPITNGEDVLPWRPPGKSGGAILAHVLIVKPSSDAKGQPILLQRSPLHKMSRLGKSTKSSPEGQPVKTSPSIAATHTAKKPLRNGISVTSNVKMSAPESGRTRKRPRVSYAQIVAGDSDDEPFPEQDSDFEDVVDKSMEDVSEDDISTSGAEAESADDTDVGQLSHEVLDLVDVVMSEMDEPPSKVLTKRTAVKKPPKPKPGNSKRDLDLNLSPIDNIRDIFQHITQNAIDRGFGKVIDHFGQRPLRVATMCSGTESPLLALKLVQQTLEKEFGKFFQVDHVFSAEIEPYKQAYIQRNFNPPLLFRDITEFTMSEDGKNMKAITAYGAEAEVPRDVDILVAGSSCVDLSNLNVNRVGGLDERRGESKDTFEAVRKYMNWARPPIVVLENVIASKAWVGITREIKMIGFETKVIQVDTKDYYLPHTRQRKYMLCLDKDVYQSAATHALDKWEEHMESFRRRASAPVSSFLLSIDDPRNLEILAREDLNARDSFKDEDDWEACRGRHFNVRLEQLLGSRKPVTTLLPEHGHRKWLRGRMPRELDVIDICHLIQAQNGVDAQFKTRIIDISQNVDRVDNAPLGISGCLTPNGTNYLTDASRPVNGYEALILQGIPVDEVTFTSETDGELKNLAGNAMSSTIVGPALLCALLVGASRLTSLPSAGMSCVSSSTPTSSIKGYKKLRPWTPSEKGTSIEQIALLKDAISSARQCTCEARTFLSKHDIMICSCCGQTICEKCRGSPKHEYRQHLSRADRISPQEFLLKWGRSFPLIIQLRSDCQVLRHNEKFMDEKIRADYLKCVADAFEDQFTFQQLHRGSIWTVCYESPTARLELLLSAESEWRLFVKPSGILPANARLRQILRLPIAVCSLKDGIHIPHPCMQWKFFMPVTEQLSLEIASSKEKTSSWKSRIGLPDYADEKVPKSLNVDIDTKSSMHQPDIAGHYELVPNCGTACSSLYRRKQAQDGREDRPIYFFLDPDPIGPAELDFYVFSYDCRRLQSGKARSILATLKSPWRPWEASTIQTIPAAHPGFWVVQEDVHIAIVDPTIKYLAFNPFSSKISLSKIHNCHQTKAVLSVSFIPSDSMRPKWRECAIVQVDDQEFYDELSWALREAQDLTELKPWMPISDDSFTQRCHTCSPTPPSMRWVPGAKAFKMQEDHMQAAAFEAALKQRPGPFVITTDLEESKTARITIGINIRSLAHRAIAQLEFARASGNQQKIVLLEDLNVSWNLDTNFIDSAALRLPKFDQGITSNADTPTHAPVCRMRLPLRDEQLRSLTWMESQESGHGVPFQLEHVEEAILPKLSWKAEVKATATTYAKGGVLADQPSYGKTIISLALIDEEFAHREPSNIVKEFGHSTSYIDTAATLIVTPGHLVSQWRDEIRKFLPSSYDLDGEVLEIAKYTDLAKLTIRGIKRAKIVLVSWTVFEAEKYLNQLALLAGLPAPDSESGRDSRAWMELAGRQLSLNVQTLQNSTSINAFATALNHQWAANLNDPAFQAKVPIRRLKGEAYQRAKAQTSSRKGASKTDKMERPKGEITATNTKLGFESMIHPIFHLFHWNRLIVDEFALITNKSSRIFSSIAGLHAEKRWILSGTPPLDDFHDIKQIACLLGIHLGIDAFSPGALANSKIKTLRAELSSAEKFRSLQEMRSLHWHIERHTQAKAFLDTFVRSNNAAIEHVRGKSYLKPVRLGASHQAVYEELSMYLGSVNIGLKENKKRLGSDREERMNRSIRNCLTADKALLRSAALFVIDKSKNECEDLVSLRTKQLKVLRKDLLVELVAAEGLKNKCADPEGKYKKWKVEPVGDNEVQTLLHRLLQKAKQQNPKSSRDSATEATKLLKEKVLDLRRLARELTSRTRALRYVQAIRTLQSYSIESGTETCTAKDEVEKLCSADSCASGHVPPSDLRIISFCGHISCIRCLEDQEHKGTCVVKDCAADHDNSHVKDLDDFGHEDPTNATSFGAKLDGIADILGSLPEGDQGILFVQDDDLIAEARNCFNHYEVANLPIFAESGSDEVKDSIEAFKSNDEQKVLILGLDSEHATGLNLTNANHVFFLSPYHANNQYEYDSKMLQAIRRAHRFGQEKTIHVYRFVALNTVDVDVLQVRERQLEQPLWENPLKKENRLHASKSANKIREGKSRLVQIDGRFALAPKTWLRESDAEYGEEDWSAHAQLSSAYEAFDDDFSVEIL